MEIAGHYSSTISQLIFRVAITITRGHVRTSDRM
jgi:hypothetical protein